MVGEETFNRYVLPTIEITPGATSVTGIHIVNSEMFHHKRKVDSISIERCLLDFVEWLKQFQNPLLVCHNGKAFDSIILMKACLNTGNISLPIKGFVDSLCVVREVLPGRKTYKLETLVKDSLEMCYDAHSAVEDVKALQSLFVHYKLSCDILLKHSFSVEYVIQSIHYKSRTNECLSSLHPLSNSLSNYMLKKIALSGLSYQHLKMAFERGGQEGIENILSETNNNGVVRVTKTKSVFAKIIAHFSN